MGICSKNDFVYVIRCKDPSKYYVGSTYRHWGARVQEHKDGYGSRFTKKYGFGRIIKRIPCALADLGRLENQIWLYYARYVCGPLRCSRSRSPTGCCRSSSAARASSTGARASPNRG